MAMDDVIDDGHAEGSPSPMRRMSFAPVDNSDRARQAAELMLRRLRKLEMRAWDEFGKTKRLNVPKTDMIHKRIASNCLYYQANYCSIAIVALCFVCVARPMFLVSVLLAVCSAFYWFLMRPPTRASVMGVNIGVRYQIRVFIGFWSFVFMFAGSFSLLVASILAGAVIIGHASLRVPCLTLKASSSSMSEMVKSKEFIRSLLLGLDEPTFDEENPSEGEDMDCQPRHFDVKEGSQNTSHRRIRIH